jgi:cytochrome c oxidase subunit 2
VNSNRVALAVFVAMVAGTPGLAHSEENHSRGRALFELCAQCHGQAAGGNPLALAPAIRGLSQWYIEAQLSKFRKGVRGAHPEDIAGMRMGPMSLTLASEEDLRAVASYVASLPPLRPDPALSGGDPEKGKASFALCSTCHGPDAAGNPQIKAPPLRQASDWYLFAQLKKFKAGIRGSNPADQTGILMPPMASTLADEQAMKDVIAYIGTLAE